MLILNCNKDGNYKESKISAQRAIKNVVFRLKLDQHVLEMVLDENLMYMWTSQSRLI